jgi:hypothetical protein
VPFFCVFALVPWARGEGGEEPRVDLRRRLGRTAALALGVTLMLAANGLWNLEHTGHFIPVRVGQSASASRWDGSLARFAAEEDRGPLSIWDFVDRTRDQLERRSSDDRVGAFGVDVTAWKLADILADAPHRTLLTFRDIETTFQYGYYGERRELTSLNVLPITFGTLVLLGLLGGIDLVRRRGVRALLPYLPFVLGTIATTMLTIPDSRYRLVMVIPLLVLAGRGALSLGAIRGRRLRTGAILATSAICAALTVRTMTYELAHPGLWEIRVAQADARLGDVDSVRRRVRRALELEPNDEHVRLAAEALLGPNRRP